jgi:NADPH2:quinone reductase
LAGEITEVGSAVSDEWKIGDRVAPYLMGIDLNNHYARTGRENLAANDFIGITRPGGYAEYSAIPESHLVRIPDGLSYADAAATQIAFGTAFHMLFTRGRLAVGETVLINSVGSGIGSAAVQLAAMSGARIIGTSSGDDKLAAATKLGMHHGINYTKQDIVAEVKKITKNKGVPVVFDGVGKDTWAASLDCLQPRGLMVSFGNASGAVAPIPLGILNTKGSIYVTRPSLGAYTATRAELEASARSLFKMVKSGKVKISIDQHYPLAEAAQAHIDLESRKTTGQTVLVP